MQQVKDIERLQKSKKHLEEIIELIDLAIEGKTRLSDISRQLKITPQKMNYHLNNAFESYVKKIDVLKDSDIEKIIIDTRTPLENLMIDVFVGCEDSSTLLPLLSEEDEAQLIGNLKGLLSEKELRIINMRYGLDGTKPLIYQEIGQALGVTTERIRQIHCKIVKKIRHPRWMSKLFEGTDLFNIGAEENWIPDSFKQMINKEIDKEVNLQVAEYLKENNIEDKSVTIKKLKISDDLFAFSTRTNNALVRAGLFTLGDIVGMQEDDFRKIRNLGESSVKEIMDVLSLYNLH